jgi:membrane-associated phospholipid phosphatase
VGDLAWFALALTLVRVLDRASHFAELFYRISLVGLMVGSYLQLRWILPVVSARPLDAELFALDLRLFGVEPALAWDAFVSPGAVEWFSFFYYSYFHFTASFVFVMIASCSNDARLASFATGLLLVVAVGHIVYTLVPGFSPYADLAHDYRAPLEGGVFYRLVLDTVGKAGPLRDIFPSLHTAMPTYCALFAWRHYPRIAALATFFAANIIVATIVLRWHYAVDVGAGLILGITAFFISSRLVDVYQARRESVGLAHLRRW